LDVRVSVNTRNTTKANLQFAFQFGVPSKPQSAAQALAFCSVSRTAGSPVAKTINVPRHSNLSANLKRIVAPFYAVHASLRYNTNRLWR